MSLSEVPSSSLHRDRRRPRVQGSLRARSAAWPSQLGSFLIAQPRSETLEHLDEAISVTLHLALAFELGKPMDSERFGKSLRRALSIEDERHRGPLHLFLRSRSAKFDNRTELLLPASLGGPRTDAVGSPALGDVGEEGAQPPLGRLVARGSPEVLEDGVDGRVAGCVGVAAEVALDRSDERVDESREHVGGGHRISGEHPLVESGFVLAGRKAHVLVSTAPVEKSSY